jgi:hypothetical protein
MTSADRRGPAKRRRLRSPLRWLIGGLAATTVVAFSMGGCGGDNGGDPSGPGTSSSSSNGGNGGNGGSGGSGGNIGGGGASTGSLEAWEGEWSGVLEQQTNDFFATMSLGITVNDDGSVELVVDQGPLAAGRDPDPETFSIPASEAQFGNPITVFSTIYGLITATFNADGTFDFTQEVFGLELEVNGSLDTAAGEIKGFYSANLLGGFNHGGRATLCPGGCPDGPEPPGPPDCSMVMPTQGAGMACTAACTPTDGACVAALCLQSCIPGECGALCQADEQCVAVENMGVPIEWPDGRTFGGCSSDGIGPNAAFETCAAGSLCQSGLRCLTFANAGQCYPSCDSDTDCTPFMGQATGCDFADLQQGKKYCGLRCTPTEDVTTGSAECPAGETCLPSPAGGNCVVL